MQWFVSREMADRRFPFIEFNRKIFLNAHTCLNTPFFSKKKRKIWKYKKNIITINIMYDTISIKTPGVNLALIKGLVWRVESTGSFHDGPSRYLYMELIGLFSSRLSRGILRVVYTENGQQFRYFNCLNFTKFLKFAQNFITTFIS